jgi:hypothetical protein
MTDHMYLVPTFDVNTLACQSIGVVADCEAAAVWEVLRNAAQLRFTGGEITRVVVDPNGTPFDPWAKRHQPARLRETA